MALSEEFVAQHIRRWEETLTTQFYSYRRGWPSRLFHHAPLENAALILREGVLRSRNDPNNRKQRDVAAPGVIDNRAQAHSRVRLYFRPKTPTQYNIEGIRKTGECPNGEETHAPVLVMFVLDARSVLTRGDVLVSDQNMQRAAAVAAATEEHFSRIPFEKVYHEGGFGGDDSIKYYRCAEVLPTSPLPLDGCLREVCFRSEPERETLLTMLGDARAKWAPLCHVSDTLKVFEKRFTFVEAIELTNEGVVFALNHRWDRGKIDIRIRAWDEHDRLVLDFYNAAHDAKPATGGRWIFKRALSDGLYRVTVHLESHLAFQGNFIVGNSLF